MPHGGFRETAAWGSLLVSLFVGASLVVALVDIPIAARITVYPDSQLSAALVLVRFLIALPVGALVGGWLTQRFAAGLITLAGLVLAAVGFIWMSQWNLTSLENWVATRPFCSAASVSGSPSRPSTPHCSRPRTTASTVSPARCRWSPGWSGCLSASAL